MFRINFNIIKEKGEKLLQIILIFISTIPLYLNLFQLKEGMQRKKDALRHLLNIR